MNIFQAVFLGILQGLTEFLPVSSSGHLVLAQHLIPNFSQPGVLFDVILHAGTLCSVLFYFRKSIFKLDSKYLKMIIVGTIPVGLLGFLFQFQIELLFTSAKLVGFALLITAIMNYLTNSKYCRKIGTYKGLSLAFLVGVFQFFALIPGISRSGSTIFAGTKFGFKKEEAAKFSFLLSIPAVLGANLVQITKYGFSEHLPSVSCFLGFVAAFVSGFFAIGLVFNILKQGKFKIFATYCVILGALTIFLF